MAVWNTSVQEGTGRADGVGPRPGQAARAGADERDGSETMASHAECFYAVAVRDPAALYLELRIRRADSGVYVIFARPERIEVVRPPAPKKPRKLKWDPHASYHRSGVRHQQSFDHNWLEEQRQPLDGHFRGTEWVVATPLTSAVTTGIPCHPHDFADVLEVARADVLPDRDTVVSASVDLAEPGQVPVLGPDRVIVEQRIYRSWTPYLVVTVYRSRTAGDQPTLP